MSQQRVQRSQAGFRSSLTTEAARIAQRREGVERAWGAVVWPDHRHWLWSLHSSVVSCEQEPHCERPNYLHPLCPP